MGKRGPRPYPGEGQPKPRFYVKDVEVHASAMRDGVQMRVLLGDREQDEVIRDIPSLYVSKYRTPEDIIAELRMLADNLEKVIE